MITVFRSRICVNTTKHVKTNLLPRASTRRHRATTCLGNRVPTRASYTGRGSVIANVVTFLWSDATLVRLEEISNPTRGSTNLLVYKTYRRWTSSLPSCLWSLRIFPSLPGSRLTIFYRDASSALLLLVNQWLNFTYSRSHAFRYERKNANPTLVRIELTTSALAGVQVNY